MRRNLTLCLSAIYHSLMECGKSLFMMPLQGTCIHCSITFCQLCFHSLLKIHGLLVVCSVGRLITYISCRTGTWTNFRKVKSFITESNCRIKNAEISLHSLPFYACISWYCLCNVSSCTG